MVNKYYRVRQWVPEFFGVSFHYGTKEAAEKSTEQERAFAKSLRDGYEVKLRERGVDPETVRRLTEGASGDADGALVPGVEVLGFQIGDELRNMPQDPQ